MHLNANLKSLAVRKESRHIVSEELPKFWTVRESRVSDTLIVARPPHAANLCCGSSRRTMISEEIHVRVCRAGPRHHEAISTCERCLACTTPASDCIRPVAPTHHALPNGGYGSCGGRGSKGLQNLQGASELVRLFGAVAHEAFEQSCLDDGCQLSSILFGGIMVPNIE